MGKLDFVARDDLKGLGAFNISLNSGTYKKVGKRKIPVPNEARMSLNRKLLESNALKVTTALGLSSKSLWHKKGQAYVKQKTLDKVEEAYKKFEEGNKKDFTKLFLNAVKTLDFHEKFNLKIMHHLDQEGDIKLIKKVLKVAGVTFEEYNRQQEEAHQQQMQAERELQEEEAHQQQIQERIKTQIREDNTDETLAIIICMNGGETGITKVKNLLASEIAGDLETLDNTEIFDSCIEKGQFNYATDIVGGANILALLLESGNKFLLKHYVNNYLKEDGELHLALGYELPLLPEFEDQLALEHYMNSHSKKDGELHLASGDEIEVKTIRDLVQEAGDSEVMELLEIGLDTEEAFKDFDFTPLVRGDTSATLRHNSFASTYSGNDADQSDLSGSERSSLTSRPSTSSEESQDIDLLDLTEKGELKNHTSQDSADDSAYSDFNDSGCEGEVTKTISKAREAVLGKLQASYIIDQDGCYSFDEGGYDFTQKPTDIAGLDSYILLNDLPF